MNGGLFHIKAATPQLVIIISFLLL